MANTYCYLCTCQHHCSVNSFGNLVDYSIVTAATKIVVDNDINIAIDVMVLVTIEIQSQTTPMNILNFNEIGKCIDLLMATGSAIAIFSHLAGGYNYIHVTHKEQITHIFKRQYWSVTMNTAVMTLI